MLGEPGEGWQVAMTTLLHERGTLGFALTARFEALLGTVWSAVRAERPGRRPAPADDPLVRDQVGQLAIDLEALRFTNYRALTALREDRRARAGGLGRASCTGRRRTSG